METKRTNGTQDRELMALLDELMNEPFARENQFSGLNLDQVGKTLEDAREAFLNAEETPELPAAKESFDKCVSLYCMVLMELERQRVSPLPDESLFELTHRDEGTQVVAILPPRPKPAPAAPKAPVAEASPEKPGEATPLFPDLKDEEIPSITPMAETGGTFEGLSIEGTDEETPLLDEPALTATGSPHEKEFRSLLTGIASARARDHLEIALYFQLIKGGSFPFSPDNADRLSAQAFYFALESECAAKITPALASFWLKREAAIRGLLDAGNRRFELHPSLKRGLDSLAKAHGDWLPEGRYPYSATLNSLRYIAASLQAESFQPSLLETGCLIFFFGQNQSVEGFGLKNQLAMQGLSASEIVEMTFRLSRSHKVRTRVVSANADVQERELEAIQQDVKRLLGLLAKLEIGDGKDLKRVA